MFPLEFWCCDTFLLLYWRDWQIWNVMEYNLFFHKNLRWREKFEHRRKKYFLRQCFSTGVPSNFSKCAAKLSKKVCKNYHIHIILVSFFLLRWAANLKKSKLVCRKLKKVENHWPTYLSLLWLEHQIVITFRKRKGRCFVLGNLQKNLYCMSYSFVAFFFIYRLSRMLGFKN